MAQIKLNIGFGGMGLRATFDHHPAAYLASISAAIPGIDFSDIPFEESATRGFFDSARYLLSISKPSSVSLDVPAAVPPQKTLSSYINAYLHEDLMRNLDDEGKARLLSISARYASSWLSALPLAFLGQKFSPQEWNLAVAYRLGVQLVLDPATACPAGSCNQLLGSTAHHAVRCGQGIDRSGRHNALRDFIFQQARIAQMNPELEPLHLVQNCGSRPADVLIPNVLGGKSLCIDVAVTDPLQVKFVEGASRTTSFAAGEYAKVKYSKYSDMLARKSDSLVLWPVIVESLGAWSDRAIELFDLIAAWSSRRDSTFGRSAVRFSLFRRASCILQRFNARMINNRI